MYFTQIFRRLSIWARIFNNLYPALSLFFGKMHGLLINFVVEIRFVLKLYGVKLDNSTSESSQFIPELLPESLGILFCFQC